MNQIVPFKYLWVILIVLINVLLNFEFLTFDTLIQITPIITILLLISKSLYTKPKISTITIIFSLIGILLLLKTVFNIASAIIGLLFFIDIFIFERLKKVEHDEYILWDDTSIFNGIGILCLGFINVVFILAGILHMIITPINEITSDNITTHLIINKTGIKYNKSAPTDDIDLKIAYEKKWRYIRTIHCEDTDFECVENKIKLFKE